MLYQTFEQVYNAWGIPESVFGQIYVWKNEGITLVAAFSERNHETDEIQATPNYFTDMLCYDYVLFNADHTLISASQGAKTTASFILRTIQNNDTNESFHRYSTGYGYEEWGAISSDGYIVRWSSSQDIELYNCLESRWEWIWLLGCSRKDDSVVSMDHIRGYDILTNHQSELSKIINILMDHQDILINHRLDEWEKMTYFRSDELCKYFITHGCVEDAAILNSLLVNTGVYKISYCVYDDIDCPRYFRLYFYPSITHDILYCFVCSDDSSIEDTLLRFNEYAYWEKYIIANNEFMSTFNPCWYIVTAPESCHRIAQSI